MMGMAEGCSKQRSEGSWYCDGISAVGVPENATKIWMNFRRKNMDLKSMEHLTNLRSITLQDNSDRVIKSSDFAIFHNLTTLIITGSRGGKLEKLELAGIIIFDF